MKKATCPGLRQYGEECGVFGIALKAGSTLSAAHSVYTALYTLQHRGQQSAGIASVEKGQFHLCKGPGLVPDVFNAKALKPLTGPAAIGHVRYSVTGDNDIVSAQPLVITHASGSMAVCCNGRLVNGPELRREAENRGGIFQSTSSAEVIAHLLVRERMRAATIEDAIINAMEYMVGAYSVVVLTQGKLVAFRDPNGFRPLCIGEVDGSIAFSSESCAFPVLGGRLIREVEPGEVVVADLGSGSFRSFPSGIKARSSLCMFELIYFARPDSVIDGASVDLVRLEAGRCLARRNTVEADCVVGVPDSGITPAMGFSRESGLPLQTGFVKNRYIARTFIEPTEEERAKALRIKLGALGSTLKGKRVIVVDDSIVRGNTCRRTVELIREAGAKEIHYRVASPRFIYPCFFGTDIPSSDELIAHGRTNEEIRALLGVDSLDYLPVEDLSVITKDLSRGVCDACFTGRYTVPVPIQKSGEIEP
jgi:amidophosphoribosyltransferase